MYQQIMNYIEQNPWIIILIVLILGGIIKLIFGK